MRLCNPDCLIDWRAVEPPKFKKDYEGKLLRVDQFDRKYQTGATLPPDGAVCQIERRFNGGGAGNDFTLEVFWACPACDRYHRKNIPESWISEDKAHFVEPIGLADATYALGDHPSVLYLATSYSHPDAAKRAARANLASQCAAWLMRKGWCVISPLSMGHAIAAEGAEMPSDFAAYQEVCLRMLEASDALVVLLLDGIRESVGVAAEIDHARKLGIPLNQIKLPGPDASGDAQFELIHNPRWWR